MKGFFYKLVYLLSILSTFFCVGMLTAHFVGLVELVVDNNRSKMHVISEDYDGNVVEVVFNKNLCAVYTDLIFHFLMIVSLIALCVLGIRTLRADELGEQKPDQDHYVKLDDGFDKPILESV